MQGNKVKVRGKLKSGSPDQFVRLQPKNYAGRCYKAWQPDRLAWASSRIGGSTCAREHASLLNRATASKPARAGHSLLQLQKKYGNRYVQQVLALGRKADDKAEVSADMEQAIQGARSGGQSMDSGVRRHMESAFGADFSGVRVHNDGEADTLSKTLNARAFTTGQDIFFRQGEYNPGSSSGRELLAHELTHVVQQTGDGIRRKLKIGQPGDRYETEADQAAKTIIRQEQGFDVKAQNEKRVQQQIEEEEEESVQMQPEEEEEVQMQEEEEEVQMQEEEEEVQMQDVDEPVHAKAEIRCQNDTPEWKKGEKRFKLLIGDLKPKKPKSNMEKFNLGLDKLLLTLGHEKTAKDLSSKLGLDPKGRQLLQMVTSTGAAFWLLKQGKLPNVIPDIRLADNLLLDVDLGGTFKKPDFMITLKYKF